MKTIRLAGPAQQDWGQIIALDPGMHDDRATGAVAARGADGYRRRVVAAGLVAYRVLGAVVDMSRARRWLTKRIKALPDSTIVDRKQPRFPWM